MGLVIAGERSGVGKTTIAIALLAYLRQHQASVQSFKVGPDYIDPMFHQFVTGRPCRNLDPVLTSETYVQQCFITHAATADYALIEGVMGLFDGQGKTIEDERSHPISQLPSLMGGFGSTAHVARLVNLPILLVVDCSRLSQSIAALVQGYCSFDPHLTIAGLVLNRVGSDRHLELLQTALEPLPYPILGVVRRQDNITIPDRHLGLIPTAELPTLHQLVNQLAHLASQWFNWNHLLPLLLQHSPNNQPINKQSNFFLSPTLPTTFIRLAVAQDAAFSFYYSENLEILQQLGAELIYWSPLQDNALPENIQGLILGGGFPEMFAAELAANHLARAAVRAAIVAGLPTYAECGGLMYLCEKIIDFADRSWEMVGLLPTMAMMGKKLTLGYRQVTALQDGVVFSRGTIAWGHEFHRSQLTIAPDQPLFKMQRSLQPEGWQRFQLHASYIHLHWGAMPELPQRFIHHCQQV